MIGRLGLLATLGLVLLLGSGCVIGVYSKQDYGPGEAMMGVSKNQSMPEVLRTIGAPDKVYEVGDTMVFVYYEYKGKQVATVYSEVTKSDIVIVFEGGKVAHPPIKVLKGEAMTILGVISTPIMGPTIGKDD